MRSGNSCSRAFAFPASSSCQLSDQSAIVSKPLIAVLGPTATGKSSLGLALAETLDGEIINCDSTAVYRGFDIGTDKVPHDERRGIPHHLIDIVDPAEDTRRRTLHAMPWRAIARDPRAGQGPDSRRRYGFLLSLADARPVPGTWQRRGTQAPARSNRGAPGRRIPLAHGQAGGPPHLPRAFSRAIASVSCGRWKSTFRPVSRSPRTLSTRCHRCRRTW